MCWKIALETEPWGLRSRSEKAGEALGLKSYLEIVGTLQVSIERVMKERDCAAA
jgi:hypothetical protein